MPDRREFMRHVGALSLALPLGSSLASAATVNGDPLFRISLAQWSYHRRLRGEQKPVMDNLDFAATARRHGIDAVEYVNAFFKKKARDAAYLAEMKRRADGEGVKSLLIMVDGEGRLGDADSKKQKAAVEKHHRWVDAAKSLGCHSIRVNAGSTGSREEQLSRVAEGLSSLTEYGAKAGINVIVENHGGLSSDGAWLSAVIKKVGHPRCGTLPDFGNFRLGGGKEYDRYRGVKELMPFARAVSAKAHDFNSEGEETHTDYLRMMRIVVDAGYRGYVGIEYEGEGLSEDAGIKATKRLLERVRSQLSKASGGKK